MHLLAHLLSLSSILLSLSSSSSLSYSKKSEKSNEKFKFSLSLILSIITISINYYSHCLSEKRDLIDHKNRDRELLLLTIELEKKELSTCIKRCKIVKSARVKRNIKMKIDSNVDMSQDININNDIMSSKSINVLDMNSITSIAKKTIESSISSINFIISDQIEKSLKNQKKRKFENNVNSQREMTRSQVVNHFQNAKILLLKAAMLSENSKITSVIEQIDQLIDSKNETFKKENSMLDLHKKINRINQLLERQNARNNSNTSKCQFDITFQKTNLNNIKKSINQSKIEKTKSINHDIA